MKNAIDTIYTAKVAERMTYHARSFDRATFEKLHDGTLQSLQTFALLETVFSPMEVVSWYCFLNDIVDDRVDAVVQTVDAIRQDVWKTLYEFVPDCPAFMLGIPDDTRLMITALGVIEDKYFD